MIVLKHTEFGDPILRKSAKELSKKDIFGKSVQTLITNMHFTLTDKKLGVGLASPQVGQDMALAVINIQKTPLRDNVVEVKLTIINPKILETYGRRSQMWEGCISSGRGGAGLSQKYLVIKRLN